MRQRDGVISEAFITNVLRILYTCRMHIVRRASTYEADAVDDVHTMCMASDDVQRTFVINASEITPSLCLI